MRDSAFAHRVPSGHGLFRRVMEYVCEMTDRLFSNNGLKLTARHLEHAQSSLGIKHLPSTN